LPPGAIDENEVLNIRDVFADVEPATDQQYLRQHIFVFISNILRAFRDAEPADCLICDLIAFAQLAFKHAPASQCLIMGGQSPGLLKERARQLLGIATQSLGLLLQDKTFPREHGSWHGSCAGRLSSRRRCQDSDILHTASQR
jgi:hypothetical protein